MKMVEIPTATMTGDVLDWAVVYTQAVDAAGGADVSYVDLAHAALCASRMVTVSPSTAWSQAGPIIDENKISIVYLQCEQRWVANLFGSDPLTVTVTCSGPTALVAAMRAYVLNRLGPLVEVPESLVKSGPAS